MSEIRANSITDAAGTGAPNFPNGLESDGVAVATTADINSAFEFISSATISNVATVDFTGFDSSKYSDYVFSLDNVISVNDPTELSVRFSTDGGSSFIDSGYTYTRITAATTSVSSTGNSSGVSVLSLLSGLGSDTNEFGVSGEFKVFGPALSARTFCTGLFHFKTSGGLPSVCVFGGENGTTTAVNAVRFIPSTGDFESGRITMYGVRNS
jgi:hypothetical protein